MYNNTSKTLFILFLLFTISNQSKTAELSSYNCILIYNRLVDNLLSLNHCESITDTPKYFGNLIGMNVIACVMGFQYKIIPILIRLAWQNAKIITKLCLR
jgi:hypothetical protein